MRRLTSLGHGLNYNARGLPVDIVGLDTKNNHDQDIAYEISCWTRAQRYHFHNIEEPKVKFQSIKFKLLLLNLMLQSLLDLHFNCNFNTEIAAMRFAFKSVQKFEFENIASFKITSQGPYSHLG